MGRKRGEVIDMTSGASRRRARVGGAAAGALAAALGTAAMDGVLYLMYRRTGGKQGPIDWEFSAGVDNWGAVSAPGLVGQKALQGFFGHQAPDRWARSTQNIVHWATGVGYGSPLGALAGRPNVCPGPGASPSAPRSGWPDMSSCRS